VVDNLGEFANLDYAAHRETANVDIITSVSLAILGHQLQMTTAYVRVLYRFSYAIYIKLFTVSVTGNRDYIIAEG
jgi:hypothetical protein